MAKVHRIETREALEDAAGIWIARLEADDVSEDDQRRFADWLAEDERHREAFEAMRQTWHRLDALGAVVSRPPAEQSTMPSTNRRHVVWATAATVLLAIGAATWWQVRVPAMPHYETAVGHQLTVPLDDGSTIQLNTNTRIAVNYSSRERTLHLERGEAHFTVSPDATRPFVVLAGNGAVRAVGTQFNVYLTTSREAEVTVTEGIVEITSARPTDNRPKANPSAAKEQPSRVSGGQRVRYNGQIGQIAEVSPPDLERRLSWRQGMLSFDGETLQQVVDQVSRYTDIEFIIVDPELRDLEVGGYFRSTDVDALANLLQSAFGVEVQRQGQRIYLTRRGR